MKLCNDNRLHVFNTKNIRGGPATWKDKKVMWSKGVVIC